MADPTASTTTDTIKKMNNFKCLSWLETAKVSKYSGLDIQGGLVYSIQKTSNDSKSIFFQHYFKPFKLGILLTLEHSKTQTD